MRKWAVRRRLHLSNNSVGQRINQRLHLLWLIDRCSAIMWQAAKKWLSTWQGIVVVSGSVLVGGTGVYLLTRSKDSTSSTATDCKLVPIEVVSREVLLDYFHRTRERYSRQYRSMKVASRAKRRQVTSGSPAYEEIVREFDDDSTKLMKEIATSVMDEMHLTEQLINQSLIIYSTDEEIEQAKEDTNSAINYASVPKALTVEKMREILTYYQDHLEVPDETNISDYLVSVAMVEDDIYRLYGYEVEEVEKAYERDEGQLKDMTESLVALTKSVIQQTRDESDEEITPN